MYVVLKDLDLTALIESSVSVVDHRLDAQAQVNIQDLEYHERGSRALCHRSLEEG